MAHLEMVHYQKFWVIVLLRSWPFGSTYWVLSIAIPKTFMNFKVQVLSPSPRYWVLLYLSSEFKFLDYGGQCSDWKLFDLHCTVWSLPYYISRQTLILLFLLLLEPRVLLKGCFQPSSKKWAVGLLIKEWPFTLILEFIWICYAVTS